jgi:malonyl-CoA O-methyltransferase
MKSSLIKKAFNKAANQYDASCELQLKTGAALIELLKKHVLQSNSILDAGCGTGLMTKNLAAQFDFKEFYAIDMADQLLERAKEKLHPLNIRVELADFNHIQHIPTLFDIIYANLSLHWSDNLDHTLVSMRNKLNNNGTFAFSIPLFDTFQEIRNYCSINTFSEMPFIKQRILNTGLDILDAKTQTITFQFENILEALKSIKLFGGDFVAKENRDKSSFTKLRKQIKSNNPVELNYHVGYFIVKKLRPL